MARASTVVRLTGNYQVSVPKALREQLGLKLGDFLETSVQRGAVVMRPKVLTDPGRLAAERARAGVGVSRAFDTADELIADLHRTTRRVKRKRRRP
jgi:AbrB family looped-hinge helix DNA binding protein